MKLAVLTSSRADYSIYYPLLKKIQNDSFFSLSVLAFGTHLSQTHGFTVQQIVKDGFNVTDRIETAPDHDTPQAIAESMARTMMKFSKVWQKEEFDMVFCLGDRYEMFAACASTVPFNLKLAHIHGGEETLGAIDDAFRHSITHMSDYHFTSAEQYKNRVIQLKGFDTHVYNVGALSIDNLTNLQLYTIDQFRERFNIDLSIPTILITFHPETISFDKNRVYVDELISALEQIEGYQFVITMPNADTLGNFIRERLLQFVHQNSNAIAVESLGTIGYLSCMKHCSFMLGNTSSGYIEASFFPKYVIDLGDRQKGRIVTPNICKCSITKSEILAAVNKAHTIRMPQQITVYGRGDSASQIIHRLKSIHD